MLSGKMSFSSTEFRILTPRCRVTQVAIALALSNGDAVAQSAQPNVLNQFQGLSRLQNGPPMAHRKSNRFCFLTTLRMYISVLFALPFLPGQVRNFFYCTGLGCNGADIDVSGTGFDCLYAHSRYNENAFAWTFKGGTNTDHCPPDAEFNRVPTVAADEVGK